MLITDQKTLETFCKRIQNEEFITVDTEFLREKTYYPKLCLIQISGADKKGIAIDPLADHIDLEPVLDLMRKPDLLKVFHAGRQDLEIFFKLMGELPSPIFDTQIAAMVCGYGDQIGYHSLVSDICDETLDKSTQFTNWSRRPLSQKQIDYAIDDVTHLVDIYYHLSNELEQRGRTEWVFEEERVITNPATYNNAPQEAWKRVKVRTPSSKTLAVLRELAAWREEQAQRKDIPKNWVMRDDTLADMAAQAPATLEDLSKIRNIPGDLEAGNIGNTLISLIKKGLKSPQKSWPKPNKRKPVPAESGAKLDILKMLLKVQAAMHDVAPRLIASQEDIEAFVMRESNDNPILNGWRFEVFGKDAVDLKEGKLAIGIKGSSITKYKVTEETDTHS